MHESHLSCIQMINLSLPVSTYLPRVSFRTVKWDSRIGFSIWVDSVLLAFNFILNFLVVTRDPVPGHILKTWQPSARPSVSAKGSRKSETEPEDSDVSTDYTDDKSLSPLHLVHNKVQVDSEEEPEVVYVKTGQSMSASKLLI